MASPTLATVYGKVFDLGGPNNPLTPEQLGSLRSLHGCINALPGGNGELKVDAKVEVPPEVPPVKGTAGPPPTGAQPRPYKLCHTPAGWIYCP